MSLSARNKAFLPGALFMLISSIFILRFGTIILVLTILPTFVAYFLDTDPRKPMFKVVAACNLSAALPYMIDIVKFSLQKLYTEAGLVMEDPRAWAYVYCGAGAGWGMLFLARFLARAVTLMHYEYNISVLDKKQELLVKEWGDAIKEAAAKRHGRH